MAPTGMNNRFNTTYDGEIQLFHQEDTTIPLDNELKTLANSLVIHQPFQLSPHKFNYVKIRALNSFIL